MVEQSKYRNCITPLTPMKIAFPSFFFQNCINNQKKEQITGGNKQAPQKIFFVTKCRPKKKNNYCALNDDECLNRPSGKHVPPSKNAVFQFYVPKTKEHTHIHQNANECVVAQIGRKWKKFSFFFLGNYSTTTTHKNTSKLESIFACRLFHFLLAEIPGTVPGVKLAKFKQWCFLGEEKNNWVCTTG